MARLRVGVTPLFPAGITLITFDSPRGLRHYRGPTFRRARRSLCMPRLLPSWIVTLLVLAMPPLAVAQGAVARGALTGTVRDASGAVLPGVTVEAGSPALIEKVRSVITDNAGVYRIVDLGPGVYSLTYTLQGFSQVKREGIELTGSATLTIPIEDRKSVE